MKNHITSALALAIGLTLSAGAMAESMPKDQYKSMEKTIASDYKVAKDGCDSLAGNARDICVAGAKGKKNVAQAELDYNYKPSVKTQYNVRVARADADYAVANEKCDDKAGNDKSVCVKEARAVKVHAVADATALMKTSNANITAREKTADASITANEKTADARKDATADKRSADYALAKVKCDALAGNAKDLCINDAKVRYSQN